MVQRDFFAFCKSLRLVELKTIGSLSTVRHFGENETVYTAEDEGHELFIVTRGAAELLPRNGRPGVPTTVLSRGDIFGETGALLKLPHGHGARACAALSVQCFRQTDFPELMQRVPSFFVFIAEKLASQLFQARELTNSLTNSLELTGSLANFDIVTIYQTIIQSNQTGLLTITDEGAKTISTFYFDKGVPSWGHFQHLSGEEAFWQLFLHEHRSGSFSFSNETLVCGDADQSAIITRQPEEILINAIQMRDQFDDLRKRMSDTSAQLIRERLNLDWDDPTFQDLRPVAEEIWQLAYSYPLNLTELHNRSRYCDWKIYRAVEEMIRSGLFSLRSKSSRNPELAKAEK